MLIQWHLLLQQLQQSDEAYESLAGDMGTTGTQSEAPKAKTAKSGIALKTLHQRLGNQGFQQFIEMKQASLQENSPSKVVSKPEAKTEQAENLQAEIQALPKLDSAPIMQDKKQTDKETLTQTEQVPEAVTTVNEPSNDETPLKTSGSHEQIVPALLLNFKKLLPLPTNTLWKTLEKHYLQLQSRQQARLVSNLTRLLKARSNEHLQVFLDGIKEVSSLHIVQAVLAKIMPQMTTLEVEVVEIDEPAEPDED